MDSVLFSQPLSQSRTAFSTVEGEDTDKDEDLPSCDELSLEFRSAKYTSYFRRTLELDNHKGDANSRTAELSSKVMRPGDSQENPIIAGDDEDEDDDKASNNDGKESGTITPGDSQANPIILDDVPESNDEAVAGNDDSVNKSNNAKDDPKNESLSQRSEDIARVTQGDVGEEAEQLQCNLLHPSVDVTGTEAGKEREDEAAHQVEPEQRIPEGPPPTQPVDQRSHPATDTSSSPDEPSMKRSCPFTDASVPRSKRPRRTLVETRKAREAREAGVAPVPAASVASFNSFGSKRLGPTIPLYFRHKEWEIDDLDNVDFAEDGSLWCTVRWKPTTLNAKTLVGKAVKKRLKELFVEKYGVEAWKSRQLS